MRTIRSTTHRHRRATRLGVGSYPPPAVPIARRPVHEDTRSVGADQLRLDLQAYASGSKSTSRRPRPDCAMPSSAPRRWWHAIDEFGTSEPVVQIQGRAVSSSEAGGRERPGPRQEHHPRTRSSQFRNDELFRDPYRDHKRAAAGRGDACGPGAADGRSLTQLFGSGHREGRQAPKARRRKGKRGEDTTDLNAPALRRLLFPRRCRRVFVPESAVPVPRACWRARCAAADSPGHRAQVGYRSVVVRGRPELPDALRREDRPSSRLNTSRTRRPRATRSPTSRREFRAVTARAGASSSARRAAT